MREPTISQNMTLRISRNSKEIFLLSINSKLESIIITGYTGPNISGAKHRKLFIIQPQA